MSAPLQQRHGGRLATGQQRQAIGDAAPLLRRGRLRGQRAGEEQREGRHEAVGDGLAGTSEDGFSSRILGAGTHMLVPVLDGSLDAGDELLERLGPVSVGRAALHGTIGEEARVDGVLHLCEPEELVWRKV